MKKLLASMACCICVVFSSLSFAETRTISWNPVTTYIDGSQIELDKIVSYISYWSTDNTIALSSLHQIGTIGTAIFATFDPTFQGMIRGTTVYFTAKAMLNTGEESVLSPSYSWFVPIVSVPGTPGKPTLNSIQLNR